MDFDSILFAKYLEGGGTQLKLFFDQTVSTWDGQAGNNFYCTDYISISKSPDKVVVEYDGTKYNCTKELDEEFGSYYYGAEYDAQNDTLDFSKYPFRAWFSDEDETLISLMAPDDQTHTFKIYEVKSGGGSSVDVESLSVTANGTYTAPTGKAYSPVNVNVSGSSGALTVASGTFTGTGANNVTFTVGKKMPKTDFVFSFSCTDDTLNYDTYYKYADGSLVLLKKYSSFDLSSTGDDRPIVTSLSYSMDNSGTPVTVQPNGRFWIGQTVRNNSVNANAPHGFSLNYSATGFTIKLSQNNGSYSFPNGANYEWSIIYFGNSPSTDIVEVA